MKGRLAQSRTSLLAIILLGIMAVFVLRLFQLQVLQHGKYVELAGRNLHDGRQDAGSGGAEPHDI